MPIATKFEDTELVTSNVGDTYFSVQSITKEDILCLKNTGSLLSLDAKDGIPVLIETLQMAKFKIRLDLKSLLNFYSIFKRKNNGSEITFVYKDKKRPFTERDFNKYLFD